MRNGSPWRKVALWVGAGAAALAVAGWSFYVTRGSTPEVDRAELRGRVLVALDKEGTALWKKEFKEQPTVAVFYADPGFSIRTMSWRAGDRKEVVAALLFQPENSSSAHLYCFDGSGGLRWQWDPKVELLDFNGKPFEPSWSIGWLLPDPTGHETTLWVSVVNPLRWASALYRLDSNGTARMQFANAGSIQNVLRLPKEAGSRLLIAGINNAWDTPFVAEIDAAGTPGFSPPGGSPRYHFANDPKGQARKYLLLPRSEIHQASGMPYFSLHPLATAGELVIATVSDQKTGLSVFNYEFAHDLTPQKVRVTATGMELHRRLEASGQVSHAAAQCPELNKPHTLRIWTPEAGWKDMPVPVASWVNQN